MTFYIEVSTPYNQRSAVSTQITTSPRSLNIHTLTRTYYPCIRRASTSPESSNIHTLARPSSSPCLRSIEANASNQSYLTRPREHSSQNIELQLLIGKVNELTTELRMQRDEFAETLQRFNQQIQTRTFSSDGSSMLTKFSCKIVEFFKEVCAPYRTDYLPNYPLMYAARF